MQSQLSLIIAAISSTKACGVTPFAAAFSSFFGRARQFLFGKRHCNPLGALEPSNTVSQYNFVGVADVWFAACIGNGSSNIVITFVIHFF